MNRNPEHTSKNTLALSAIKKLWTRNKIDVVPFIFPLGAWLSKLQPEGPNAAREDISSGPRRHFVNNENGINIRKTYVLIWQNVIYPEIKALRKISGPQTVVYGQISLENPALDNLPAWEFSLLRVLCRKWRLDLHCEKFIVTS